MRTTRRRDECRQQGARHDTKLGAYFLSVQSLGPQRVRIALFPCTSRPLPCTSCRCFRAQVQTLGCLISTCQVRVQSRRLPPLLFGITPTPAPLVWQGALPLPLTTIEPHLNQTPVGQDCLVESTPKSWPSSVSPMGAINVKATTACSPRSRHGREPDTGQYHGDSSVAFTAGLPLSAWPRS